MRTAGLILPLCLLLAACGDSTTTPAEQPAEASQAEWVPLFDGETLDGWQNPYDWGEAWVEEGEIRLLADRKFFLVTDREYSDFELQAEVMLPDDESNSGFMFRAHVEPNNVYGYQAEVDPTERGWSGGLYDEGRRQWLHPVREDTASVQAFRANAGDAYRHDGWNEYTIRAVGDSLTISLNGVQTTAYQDTVDASGYIGIQHHGEAGKTYRFRNLRIREL